MTPPRPLTRQGVRNLDALGPRPRARQQLDDPVGCSHRWVEEPVQCDRECYILGCRHPFKIKICPDCGARKS